MRTRWYATGRPLVAGPEILMRADNDVIVFTLQGQLWFTCTNEAEAERVLQRLRRALARRSGSALRLRRDFTLKRILAFLGEHFPKDAQLLGWEGGSYYEPTRAGVKFVQGTMAKLRTDAKLAVASSILGILQQDETASFQGILNHPLMGGFRSDRVIAEVIELLVKLDYVARDAATDGGLGFQMRLTDKGVKCCNAEPSVQPRSGGEV